MVGAGGRGPSRSSPCNRTKGAGFIVAARQHRAPVFRSTFLFVCFPSFLSLGRVRFVVSFQHWGLLSSSLLCGLVLPLPLPSAMAGPFHLLGGHRQKTHVCGQKREGVRSLGVVCCARGARPMVCFKDHWAIAEAVLNVTHTLSAASEPGAFAISVLFWPSMCSIRK